MAIVASLMESSGPEVQWLDGDLDDALAAAKSRTGFVFLYLYDPDDPTFKLNESAVFTKRWAREPLDNVVCMRKDVSTAHRLAARYQYEKSPLFLLLDTKGQVQGRVSGPVDERQFFTQIGQAAGRAEPVQPASE
jgi:hypothetical protein